MLILIHLTINWTMGLLVIKILDHFSKGGSVHIPLNALNTQMKQADDDETLQWCLKLKHHSFQHKTSVTFMQEMTWRTRVFQWSETYHCACVRFLSLFLLNSPKSWRGAFALSHTSCLKRLVELRNDTEVREQSLSTLFSIDRVYIGLVTQKVVIIDNKWEEDTPNMEYGQHLGLAKNKNALKESLIW